MAAAVVLVLMGGCTLADLDGLAGDAGVTGDADAATDAAISPVDGASDAKDSGTFCATELHTFCEDFSDPMFTSHWSAVYTDGILERDTVNFVSAPAAAYAMIPASMTSVTNALEKDIAGTPKEIIMAFDLYVDVAATYYNGASVAEIFVGQDSALDVVVTPSSSGLTLTVWQAVASAPGQPVTYLDLYSGFSVEQARWTHVLVDVGFGAGGALDLTVALDQALPVSPATPAYPVTPVANGFGVRLGASHYSDAPFEPWAVHLDQVDDSDFEEARKLDEGPHRHVPRAPLQVSDVGSRERVASELLLRQCANWWRSP